MTTHIEAPVVASKPLYPTVAVAASVLYTAVVVMLGLVVFYQFSLEAGIEESIKIPLIVLFAVLLIGLVLQWVASSAWSGEHEIETRRKMLYTPMILMLIMIGIVFWALYVTSEQGLRSEASTVLMITAMLLICGSAFVMDAMAIWFK